MNANLEHDLLNGKALFSDEDMGITYSEWEKIQLELKEKLFTSNALFFPGNTPSLKNSKEIFQVYSKNSNCCGAPILRYKTNGKLIAICSKCKKAVNLKRPIIVSSKPVREYKERYAKVFMSNKPQFLKLTSKYSKPFLLGFYFIRDSKRKFDYINAKQILLDMMRDYKYFGTDDEADDDTKNVIDFSLGYTIDKARPGAYIVILNNEFFKKLISYI